MRFRQLRLFTILLVLVTLSIACHLPISSLTLTPTKQPHPTPQPLPTTDVNQLRKQLQATLDNPGPSGEVTLSITQDQLNGVIASKVASQPDSPITNPQVILKDGEMTLTGTAQQYGFSVNTSAVLTPGIDDSGRPTMTVNSITVGPFEAPDSFKAQIQEQINQTLNDYLASNDPQLKVKKITVTDGLITITGVRN